MKNFPRRYFFAAFLTLAVAMATTAWEAAAAQSSAPSNGQAADAAAGIRTSDSTDKFAGENGAEKKEAAEDDAAAQFKQSPSVRWLARRLGLSGGAMYWLAVVINFAIIALGVVYWLLRERDDRLPSQIGGGNSEIDE